MPINPLIVIMSCRKNSHLWNNLKNCDKTCIIFCGDPSLKTDYVYKNRILYLKCEDTYDHLPTKVYMMIWAILKLGEFSNITHIFKLDDHDTKFSKDLKNKIINIKSPNTDYCGQLIQNHLPGYRDWHFNKCPTTSIWHNRPYPGDYVPWCDGGCGYLLSRKCMYLIVNSLIKEKIYTSHIFEDVMIAFILFHHNIHPIKINNIIVGDK
tara:strand:- start:72 stop:698 length:627 start_codon:yes stop_codon:yes gene_type:complete